MVRQLEIIQLEKIILNPGAKQYSDCQKVFTRRENLQWHPEVFHKKYWDQDFLKEEELQAKHDIIKKSLKKIKKKKGT